MRHINEIIIHATATRADWRDGQKTSTKVAEVKRWHVVDRGWSDIGYHYLIDRDGTIAKGRPIERTGAHVRGRNANSIGVSMFGGFGGAARDQFADHFTPQQEAALINLIDDLERQFPDISIISGHNQYAAKGCPCFSVPDWWPNASATLAHSDPQTAPAGGVGGLAAIIAAFFAALFGKARP